MTTRRAPSRVKAKVLPVPPPIPPAPETDPATRADISRRLQELLELQRRQHLSNAVILAQQAAAGHGPLVEHFAELGRRFAKLTRQPKATHRHGLTVIKGGAA